MSQSTPNPPATTRAAANEIIRTDPEAAAVLRALGAREERERLGISEESEEDPAVDGDEKVAERIANAGRSK